MDISSIIVASTAAGSMIIIISIIIVVVAVLLFLERDIILLYKAREQRKLLIDIIYYEQMNKLHSGILPDNKLWDMLNEVTFEQHTRALRWRLDWLDLYSIEIQELYNKYDDELPKLKRDLD